MGKLYPWRKLIKGRSQFLHSIKKSPSISLWKAGLQHFYQNSAFTKVVNSATADVVEDRGEEIHTGFATKGKKTPSLFPWRHSPELLPRLDPGNSGLYHPIGKSLPRFDTFTLGFSRLITASIMNKSKLIELTLFNAISGSWEDELASNFSLAFGVATKHLVHKGYSNPYGGEQSMLEHELRKLYDGATTKNGKQSSPAFEVLLDTKPLHAKIDSYFSVPLFTREIIRSNPQYRGSFSQFLRAYIRDRVKASDYFMKMIDEVGSLPIYHFTVILQTSILCSERFAVRDIETQEFLQGTDGKERDVVHHVQFEVVINYNVRTGRATCGSWHITDWDDLLEGNFWF